MSETISANEKDAVETMAPENEAGESPVDAEVSPQPDSESDVDVHAAEYQELHDDSDGTRVEISRFHDLRVTVAAELGKTSMPLEKLLSLGPGAVVELDRKIDTPVELIAQGVPLACGDVVVVEDRFAIRITQVYDNHPSA